MATAQLAASTVAERLRDRSTRLATLGALEADDALAAAPALCELLALDAAEVSPELYDRINLLLGRMCAEAVPRGAEAQVVVYGAAYGGGRYARFVNAEGNVLAAAVRKPAAELTRADARSYACSLVIWAPAFSRGMTAPVKAAGFATCVRTATTLFPLFTSVALCTFTRFYYLIARAVDERRPDRVPEENAKRQRAAAHDDAAARDAQVGRVRG